LVVVDAASSVELVVEPVALVGNFAVGVVEFSVALHVVVVPLTLVGTSIPVLDSAHSLLAPIKFKTLVAAVFCLLDDESTFLGGFFVKFEEPTGRIRWR
jgi:hypothetical protein